MKLNKYKAMALETTAYLILGLAGLSLILILFSSSISNMVVSSYCHVYDVLLTRLPFTEVSPPSYCKERTSSFESKYVHLNSVEDITEYLASAIFKCYAKMNNLPLRDESICDEIMINSNIDYDIHEEDIARYYYVNGMCDVLGDNDVVFKINNEDKTCGNQNNVDFEKSITNKDNHVFVVYDYKNNKVVIR